MTLQQTLDLANQAWSAAILVLAYLTSLGALLLVLVGEVWVARNMLRGWRDPSGWRGMVAIAADLDERSYGVPPARPTLVDGQPIRDERARVEARR